MAGPSWTRPLMANRAREAARKARSHPAEDRPGGAACRQLRDCNEANPELNRNIPSSRAISPAARHPGRDSRFQAISPCGAEMLNVEKARPTRSMATTAQPL